LGGALQNASLPNRRPDISVSAGYTHFFAGQFIRQNGGKDVNYGTVWAIFKF